MKKILVAFGTRPEAIKLAPVVMEARAQGLEVSIFNTGQHRELLLPFLDYFDLKPDFAANVIQEGQGLSDLNAKILLEASRVLHHAKPDLVIVQGDTTTTMGVATAAFYSRIPIAHVEAGLRSNDLSAPFPEEFNRRVVSVVAKYHFAPTDGAVKALKNESISRHVYKTGNTGIDSLRIVLAKNPVMKPENSSRKKILVTCHRRENQGDGFLSIFDAILDVLKLHPEVDVVFPVHLNPEVRKAVARKLSDHPQIQLGEPLGYFDFCQQMREANLILTDSGGVQEEAPYLKKPVLVLREVTERPEGIDAGVAKLMGTDRKKIGAEVHRLLTDSNYYASFQKSISPYGDGFAAKRIIEHLKAEEN